MLYERVSLIRYELEGIFLAVIEFLLLEEELESNNLILKFHDDSIFDLLPFGCWLDGGEPLILLIEVFDEKFKFFDFFLRLQKEFLLSQ